MWDLAYLAYRLVPLTEPSDVESAGSDAAQRDRRLVLLCEAYGNGVRPSEVLSVAVDRLHALADFTQARADDGQEELRSHVELYRRHAAFLTGALSSGPE